MIINGWVLTKTDTHNDGHQTPIVASMSLAAWHGPMQPLTTDGWMLVRVACDPAHVEFMKQDEDVIWIGSEWSKVPQQVLDTYASKLDPNETYQNLGQVLDKL